jgi:5'-nucleotidase
VYALEQDGMSQPPHVVISGVNEGQNLGTLIDLSGTVGAARAAARRGVPALAVSQGFGNPPDYARGADAAIAWLTEHRATLRAPAAGYAASVTNLNIPTCAAGRAKAAVEVPVDTSSGGIAEVDCETPYTDPTSDVDAFLHGYIARTDNLPLTPAG